MTSRAPRVCHDTFQQTLSHRLCLVAHSRAVEKVEGKVGFRDGILALFPVHHHRGGTPHVSRDLYDKQQDVIFICT